MSVTLHVSSTVFYRNGDEWTKLIVYRPESNNILKILLKYALKIFSHLCIMIMLFNQSKVCCDNISFQRTVVFIMLVHSTLSLHTFTVL